MSQTETLLLVVLGFALASLLALFIGRFAWNIAIRLGSRRMQKQVPSTVKELQTERDRLRAEYALVSQKLGSHLETVKARMAEQMAEVSRSRNRIQSLTEDVNVRDAEITLLKEKIAALDSDLAMKTADLARLEGELAERTSAVSQLESDLAASRLDAEVASVSAAATTDSLQQRIDKLAQMSGEIAESRKQADIATTPSLPTDLDEKLAAAERETAELQKELARLDAEWNDKLKDVGAGKAAPGGGEPGVANVVPLTKRMKSQQKDVGG